MTIYRAVVYLLTLTIFVGHIHGQLGISLIPSKGRDCFTGTIDHLKKSMQLLGVFRTAKMAENKELSCVATCLLKRYSVMNEEGVISSEKAKSLSQKIKDPTFKSVVEMRLSSCIEESASPDPCEHGGKFVDCVAKSGSYKNWGGVVAKNFQHIFGAAAPPDMMKPTEKSGGMVPNKAMPPPKPKPSGKAPKAAKPQTESSEETDKEEPEEEEHENEKEDEK